MRHFLIVLLGFLLCIYTQTVSLANNFIIQEASSIGLAGCNLHIISPWAGLYNQALLAKLTHNSLGISLNQHFLINTLSTYQLSYVQRIKKGAISINATRYGYKAYNHNRLGLALAKDFDTWALGMQANYLFTQIPSEGIKQYHGMVLVCGLHIPISSTLSINSQLYNPSLNRYQESKEMIPSRFSIEISYQEDVLSTYLQCSKGLESALKVAIGLSYEINERIQINTGYQLSPFVPAIGLNMRLKQIIINLAIQKHAYLGYTPAYSGYFEFHD